MFGNRKLKARIKDLENKVYALQQRQSACDRYDLKVHLPGHQIGLKEALITLMTTLGLEFKYEYKSRVSVEKIPPAK